MKPIKQVQRLVARYRVRLGFTGRMAAALCFSMAVQVSARDAVNSPPNELIDDLRREATLIARVHVQDSSVTERSGNYVSYRVLARVIKLYQGGKPRGAIVAYRSRVEQGTEDFSSTDRIVFLKRGRAASSQWYALEFGQFRYDKALERRIQQRLNRHRGRPVQPQPPVR